MRDPQRRPLGSLLSLVSDRTGVRKDRSKPYVGLEHIPSSGSLLKAVGTAADSSSTNNVFASGDVLFGKLRPRLRKSVRVNLSGYCSTDVLVLRPVQSVDPVFAGFVAQSDAVFSVAIRTEEGTKMPRCSWKDLRAVEVFCPVDRRSQDGIARVLSALDVAIEKTEALIEKHEQIKAGLMHDLFTRGVLASGQLRPRKSETPDQYHDTQIGWIPKGWHLSTLRECLAEGATNGIYKPAHLIGSGTLLVGQTALTSERSVDPRLARRAVVEAAELMRFGLIRNDILLSRVFATLEGVGQPALVPELGEPAVFESNMMRLRVNIKLVRPGILFEWLQSDTARRHISGRANASNQVSVNQSVLYPMLVPLPPTDEQDRILDVQHQCAARINTELAKLSKQRKIKLGLMQDLLTGKVPLPADKATPSA